MARIYQHIDELIGGTPLVDISALADGKARILGKVEFFNPGGSVKDRIAKAILDDAEERGIIAPGRTTLIESTSGNTGVGLAMLAAARGYKLVITMPETMSVERRNLIAAYGAELVLTPGSEGIPGANRKQQELLASTPDSFAPGQFVNPVNPQIHYQTTGPEVWADTDGDIDAFVSGVGTGGTVSGAGKYLREQKPDVKVFAVEPEESQVLAGKPAGKHGIQGIAPGFVADTMDLAVVDEVIPVHTDDAYAFQRRLSHELGILVGISSGAATAAAVRLAQRPEFAGKTIVALLPDTGERYLSLIS
ncbi:MAG: cysteine synthase A [Coriobacteriaceae bacterium]|nr:cysteine synthase A [Coriobacteriaceae bacterium]